MKKIQKSFLFLLFVCFVSIAQANCFIGVIANDSLNRLGWLFTNNCNKTYEVSIYDKILIYKYFIGAGSIQHYPTHGVGYNIYAQSWTARARN